jgi:hypothetical protein
LTQVGGGQKMCAQNKYAPKPGGRRMSLRPDQLAANAEVVETLGWASDFEPEIDPDEPLYFTVDGVDQIERIGRDGAGGEFVLLKPSGRVLYVSSEGQAGTIAADLDEFVALMIACPYWRDILKYSADGDLNEMRRAATALETSYEDDDDLEARAFLKAHFQLRDPADPVGALHSAVSASGVVVRMPDGAPCMSLFSRFTIDDTPFLSDLAD